MDLVVVIECEGLDAFKNIERTQINAIKIIIFDFFVELGLHVVRASLAEQFFFVQSVMTEQIFFVRPDLAEQYN